MGNLGGRNSSYAPTSAIVRRAHDLARELLAVWRILGRSHECATVVVDDVVLVLAFFCQCQHR